MESVWAEMGNVQNSKLVGGPYEPGLVLGSELLFLPVNPGGPGVQW